MEKDVAEVKGDHTLRFTTEEYRRMIEEVMRGEYSLFIDIVDRILKWKLVSWYRNPDVVRYGLKEDLLDEVHMCLIKEARNLVYRNEEVIDPHYFQALVITVGVGRIINFVNREKYAHGDLSGSRYEPLRRELGMQDDVAGLRQARIPMASLETGGFSEDEDEAGIEIPAPESGFATVETIDLLERLTDRINEAVAACNLSLHKVLTWFLYITSLHDNHYDTALTKIRIERRFSGMTLEEIVDHIDLHRQTVYDACVTKEQIRKLRARLDKTNKNGERLGDTVYGHYCMQGKTMRASVSDWINRWNAWFREHELI